MAPKTQTQMHNFNTTVFTNFTHVEGSAPLDKVLENIKGDAFKDKITSIRNLITGGNEKAADKLKAQLAAFTPSGIYLGGRKIELLKEYNPIICLDFDNVNGSLATLIEKVNNLPYTYSSFISPRKNGIKVFVITNSSQQNHTTAFNQVANFYESETGIISDHSVKDIQRLCFFSYDPDLYLNPDSKIFEIKPQDNLPTANTKENIDYQATFQDCVSYTENKGNYHNGDRNNFIYRLACNCNRNGIPQTESIRFFLDDYSDLPKREITNAIKNAYKKYKDEFNTGMNYSTAQKKEQETPDDNFLKESPKIPDEIYNKMPELIRNGVFVFSDSRERDVFFTGAISILSGCLPNVQGTYKQQTVFPNLFSFVISPPASGKGTLKFAKALGDKIQENIIEESTELAKAYRIKLRSYNQSQKRKGANMNEDPPVEPPFKVLYIPANSSSSKILQHLHDNDSSAIIIDTESDSMGNILKQDWGSYSDILRKSFHHENISISRRANNEYIDIPSPKLSVALTGTPGQVAGVISSAEDGLFSRFLFYVFKADLAWQDVSPNNGNINLTEHFKHLSDEVHKLNKFMSESNIIFDLTTNQWNKLNLAFTDMLDEVATFSGDNATSIVKRLGLQLYRIAMIFTAIRKYEEKNTDIKLYCSDVDFNLALQLSHIYLEHSLIMFNNLPGKDNMVFSNSSPNKKAFLNALPDKFARAEAIKIAETYNMCDRTVDGFLKKLTGIYLSKPSTGKYEKIQQNQ